MALEFMDYNVAEVLVVDGIVRAEGCCVVVENHRLVLVVSVIGAEVVHQSGDFPFELHVERLQDIQAVAAWLATIQLILAL